MGEFLSRTAASVVGRSIFQFVVLPLLGVISVAAVIDSWNQLMATPPPIKIALIVGALFIAIWVAAVVQTYLNSSSHSHGASAPRKVLWYKLPIRKVSWNLEGYLGYGRFQGGPIMVTRFGVNYKVNWGEGIVPKKAYIQCKRSGAYFDALTDPGNNFVKAEDAKFIPRGRWHSFDVQFDPPILPEEFLTKLDGFWFIAEYDDKVFKRYFSRRELDNYLDAGRRNMVPTTEPGLIG